jgi:hypothetical protein
VLSFPFMVSITAEVFLILMNFSLCNFFVTHVSGVICKNPLPNTRSQKIYISNFFCEFYLPSSYTQSKTC